MYTRKLISGRTPKAYSVKDGGFTVVNGPQKYNRVLYGILPEGAPNRFRAIAGDKPEVMLYLPGDAGRAFIGFQNAEGLKWSGQMDEIVTTY